MMNLAAFHDLPSNPNFTNHAILHLDTNEHTIALHLFTAAHGHSQRFYMDRTRFASWLSEKPAESFLDADMAMFLKAYRADAAVQFRVSFVSVHMDSSITGYLLSFSVPVGTLEQALMGMSVKLLVDTAQSCTQAKLHFSSGAQARIASYCSDKILRRALSKALRDAFHYGCSSDITLYGENDGFFFREESGICGGLIHHTSTIAGRNGERYPCHSFTVHT